MFESKNRPIGRFKRCYPPERPVSTPDFSTSLRIVIWTDDRCERANQSATATMGQPLVTAIRFFTSKNVKPSCRLGRFHKGHGTSTTPKSIPLFFNLLNFGMWRWMWWGRPHYYFSPARESDRGRRTGCHLLGNGDEPGSSEISVEISVAEGLRTYRRSNRS